MEFNEVLRLGGYKWDSYDQEFSSEVLPTDWVLYSRGSGPLVYRVLAVFDEDFLEIGESAKDAVKNWEKEVGDSFAYMFVEDFLEESSEELADPDNHEGNEDTEAQYWEDERWRDDL